MNPCPSNRAEPKHRLAVYSPNTVTSWVRSVRAGRFTRQAAQLPALNKGPDAMKESEDASPPSANERDQGIFTRLFLEQSARPRRAGREEPMRGGRPPRASGLVGGSGSAW